MIGPKSPAAAVVAGLNDLEYPDLSISGTIVRLIIAICAVVDPIIAANIMFAITFT